jgi:hypothetical protein
MLSLIEVKLGREPIGMLKLTLKLLLTPFINCVAEQQTGFA